MFEDALSTIFRDATCKIRSGGGGGRGGGAAVCSVGISIISQCAIETKKSKRQRH